MTPTNQAEQQQQIEDLSSTESGTPTSHPAVAPATPLPWVREVTRFKVNVLAERKVVSATGRVDADAQADAAYIIHACNAYPKLIAELRNAEQHIDEGRHRLHIQQLGLYV